MTDGEAFRQGVSLFRQGQWEDAAATLAEPARQKTLLGKLSHHYLGRAHYQAGLALRARRPPVRRHYAH